MSQDDEYKKKITIAQHDEETEGDSGQGGESGKGGQGGKIAFREFIAVGPLRDDLLSADEKRRLLVVHEGANEGAIKKQKDTRDQRKQLKEGKISLSDYRQRLGAGSSSSSSQYREHPMLSDKAQFSGIDRQVNALPNENIAETNNDKRNELQYQYNLVYRPQNAMRFNPKPIQR